MGKVIKGTGEAGVVYALPTANMYVEEAPQGVFIGHTVHGGRIYPSLICIRNFNEGLLLESHLFDFEGDLYHEIIEVEPTEKLRDLVPYTTEETMRALIEKDVAAARERLHLT